MHLLFQLNDINLKIRLMTHIMKFSFQIHSAFFSLLAIRRFSFLKRLMNLNHFLLCDVVDSCVLIAVGNRSKRCSTRKKRKKSHEKYKRRNFLGFHSVNLRNTSWKDILVSLSCWFSSCSIYTSSDIKCDIHLLAKM